ncbi:MAG: hypothetical protein K8I00_10975 [Candidatus Omnitrophica bacterium]|nr:hypothetical protein [Candidatus Omnitrophota bacterium]
MATNIFISKQNRIDEQSEHVADIDDGELYRLVIKSIPKNEENKFIILYRDGCLGQTEIKYCLNLFGKLENREEHLKLTSPDKFIELKNVFIRAVEENGFLIYLGD